MPSSLVAAPKARVFRFSALGTPDGQAENTPYRLASFRFLSQFFAFWFYARHLQPNQTTLIFCGAGIAGEENPLHANSGQKIRF